MCSSDLSISRRIKILGFQNLSVQFPTLHIAIIIFRDPFGIVGRRGLSFWLIGSVELYFTRLVEFQRSFGNFVRSYISIVLVKGNGD